jgi:hypothetical protein
MAKLITIFISFYPTESFAFHRPTAAIGGLKSFRGEPSLSRRLKHPEYISFYHGKKIRVERGKNDSINL